MLRLWLRFCIPVRCLLALHGSLASWLPRALVNVLENNLVRRLTAVLALVLAGGGGSHRAGSLADHEL